MTEVLTGDGGNVTTPNFGANIFYTRATLGAAATDVENESGMGAWSRTGTGVYRYTFTDAQTQVLGVVGEPCLIDPAANADAARVTAVSSGDADNAAYIEITTYDDAATTAGDLEKDVMLCVWFQDQKNEASV